MKMKINTKAPVLLSANNEHGVDAEWHAVQAEAAQALAVRYLEHLDLHGQQLADQDPRHIYRQLFIFLGGLENPGRGLEKVEQHATLHKCYQYIRYELLPAAISNQEEEGTEPPLIPLEFLPDDDDGKINLRPVQDDGVMMPIEFQPRADEED